jgi:hypothetical protein
MKREGVADVNYVLGEHHEEIELVSVAPVELLVSWKTSICWTMIAGENSRRSPRPRGC